ncbi:hypothetical protein ACSBR2_014384 [Camellia fascicularis]
MELRIRESRERIINSTTTFSSTASTSNNNNNITKKNKAIAQCNADASLLSEFEQSSDYGKSFNYSRSVIHAPQTVPEEQITAYLSGIQRVKTRNGSSEISLSNPIWVYSRSTQKPFYAILHRIDVGIIIDLEPALSGDPALSLAEGVQSQKLLARAISRLQSVPAGDIGVLCDTVVEDVQQLTGYDRVMVYKFHDDDHGEVVSETRRPDLEPYLGLHFPATDIPHAARFLFKQNRVRMICNCLANRVRIIQSKELKQPLCLVIQPFDRPMLATRSIRVAASHGTSIDITIGGEKGVTPTESQVKDIAKWLLNNQWDSTRLCTESLANAGYTGAYLLGDAVCGMATARITSKDFLFWFRSHTANKVKWAGAKHHPEDKDDGGRMHLRSSFIAFCEVVRSTSLPWEVLEINAIQSLQLIIRV